MTIKPADLDHLLDQANADLPGASNEEIKATLFDVLSEFFNETSAWQESIAISVLPTIQQYSIAPSDGGQILRLAYVADQGNITQPAYLTMDRDAVVLQLVYNSPATFRAQVVKTVAFPTDKKAIPVVPESMLSVYGTTILAGLKGTMMRQNDKSYTNAGLSTFHLQKFLDGKKIAAADVERAFTHGGQRWSYPRSWTAASQRASISTAFPRA